MDQNQILHAFDNARLGKFHLALMLLSGFCWVLAAYGVAVIGFLLPSIRAEWQVSASALGLAASITMAGMLVGSIIAGALSDWYGRRNTLFWTLLYLGILFLISAAAWSFVSLLVLRFLTGLGLGAIMPVSSTLITEFSPTKYRGTMSVLMNACWGLGGTLAALVGYTLVLEHGWRPSMLIGGLALVISPFVRLLLPESMRFLLRKGRVAEARREFSRLRLQMDSLSLTPILAGDPPPESRDGSGGGIWSAAYARLTAALWLLWAALNFLYQGAFIWLPTLLASARVSEGHSFLLTLMISIGQIPGTLIVAYLADRMSRRKLIVASLALLTAATFFLGLSQEDAWVLTMGFLLMVFNGMAWGLAYPFSSELYPTRIRGSAAGWATGIGRLGGVAAPMIVGWMIQAGSSMPAVFGLLASAPFLTAIVLSMIKSETTGRSLEEISAS
jgi:putative MFS transporter